MNELNLTDVDIENLILKFENVYKDELLKLKENIMAEAYEDYYISKSLINNNADFYYNNSRMFASEVNNITLKQEDLDILMFELKEF